MTEASTPPAREPTFEEIVGPKRARLARASGMVHDHRRLVCFFYLLLRDHAPCGVAGNAFDDAFQDGAVLTWPQEVMDRAARLQDSPTTKLRELLRCLGPTLTPEMWSAIEARLPLRDDITTTFSNGWLARYAIWLADEASDLEVGAS